MKLVDDVIAAHGGSKLWRQFNTIEAEIISGGKLFEMKGLPQDPTPRQMTVWLHEQKASVFPFGGPDQKSSFTASRAAIEKLDGKIVMERIASANELHDHLKAPKWDPLDRAYFNGYALWMYLTTPFFLLMPGLEVNEIEPWKEGSEAWKGLSVKFPHNFSGHSHIQEFYFDSDNLIRKHDYQLDIAGENFYVGQYISGLKNVQGIWMPSIRRAYKKDQDGKPLSDELMVKIDLSNFRLI